MGPDCRRAFRLDEIAAAAIARSDLEIDTRDHELGVQHSLARKEGRCDWSDGRSRRDLADRSSSDDSRRASHGRGEFRRGRESLSEGRSAPEFFSGFAARRRLTRGYCNSPPPSVLARRASPYARRDCGYVRRASGSAVLHRTPVLSCAACCCKITGLYSKCINFSSESMPRIRRSRTACSPGRINFRATTIAHCTRRTITEGEPQRRRCRASSHRLPSHLERPLSAKGRRQWGGGPITASNSVAGNNRTTMTA